MDYWLGCVRQWYPERRTKTYFSSPLKFNRVPYDKIIVADHTVLVKQPPNKPAVKSQASAAQPVVAGRLFTEVTASVEAKRLVQHSDVADDAAVEHTLSCLRALSDHRRESMMVICGLDFGRYLDKDADRGGVVDPISAAASDKLPRPATMKERSQRRGDFDVLIVHPEHGLIVGEVKSVGADASSKMRVGDVSGLAVVAKRVGKALRQLNKARDVLNHLTSDVVVVPAVKVTKTLILPFVTSAQLRQAVLSDRQLEQVMMSCLRKLFVCRVLFV